MPESSVINFSINPMGKPRMTQRDKWAKRPVVQRYNAYKDMLALQRQGFNLPDEFRVTFYMPMPVSWSKRKKESMCGKPHQQRPDGDNLVKALQDALCKEDSSIWNVHYKKVWANAGMIKIVYGDNMPGEFKTG